MQTTAHSNGLARPSSTPASDRGICMIGYMAGARAGFTTSQGLILAGLLRAEGWSPTTVSQYHNRWRRLLEILWVLLRDGGEFPVAILEVYGGWGFVLADITSVVAGWLGIPLVMVLHGGSIPEMVRSRPAWIRRVLARARVLVAPSRFLARSVESLPGLSAQVIPNVIPIEEYGYVWRQRVRPRLIWMRNFHPLYNPTMALRVLRRLVERYPDAELVMAGRYDDNCSAVQAEARKLGLEGRVSFPGFLDSAAKANLFARSDIFLNTNQIDNMPVAVIEACAFGLPVVATAVGGLPDLLTDGETGLLVPGDDDVGMAEAVIRLVEDPALASRLSGNGRQLAELSGSNRVVPQWTSLLSSLLERRPQ